MVLSAIATMFLLGFLLSQISIYISRETQIHMNAQKESSDILAEHLQADITANNLTFDRVSDNYVYHSDFEIVWLNSESASYDEIEIYAIEDGANIYSIEFSDSSGYALISSNRTEIAYSALTSAAFLGSVAFFFILFFYLIYRKLSYITTIEQGINCISNENILFKIPIIGKNELSRLAISINKMGDNLYEKMQKEREDEKNQRLLITNMSHDLRTPLTSVNGYIDIVANKLDDTNELYSYILTAKENGLRLERLIDDLFLYSKLISGDVPVRLQKTDLCTLIGQIIEIKVENIVFTTEQKNLFASIDIEKFNRIIDNLVKNAATYGVDGEPITIICKDEKECVAVEIMNKTKEDLSSHIDKLTGRLYTAHEDRSNGASGLGLSIVSELLKQMDGKLKLSFADNIFAAKITLPKI